MPDQFIKVTTTGYGKRVTNSVGGVLLGMLMFLGAFGLLYWNEGRTDISSVAANAIELPADAPADANAAGKLVSVTGAVTADTMLGDDLFLKDGSYIAVDRTVEMYAWVEETKEETQTNVGGSETTTTTYTYTKEWTASPKQESEFAHPEEHENPELSIETDAKVVSTLKVGTYLVSGNVELPATTSLALTNDLVALSSGAELASSAYIFMGSGTLASPQLGDVRISYATLDGGFDGTVFGKLSGDKIVDFVDDDGNHVWRAFSGERDAALTRMHDEFVMTTWILRLVGFFLMWFGLAAVFGPLATVLDLLPIFGSMTRIIVSLVTFPIALVLSAVTILISIILHSLIAVGIVVLVTAGIIVVVMRNRRSNMGTTPKM